MSPVAVRVQIIVVKTEIMAELMQHCLANLPAQVVARGADALVRALVYGDDIGHDATVSGEAPRDWHTFVQAEQLIALALRRPLTLVRLVGDRDTDIVQRAFEPVRKTVDGRFDLVLELLVADAHSTAFLVIEQSPCPPRSGGCPGTIGSSLTPCSKHRTAWTDAPHRPYVTRPVYASVIRNVH